jgi:hypothetical protein
VNPAILSKDGMGSETGRALFRQDDRSYRMGRAGLAPVNPVILSKTGMGGETGRALFRQDRERSPVWTSPDLNLSPSASAQATLPLPEGGAPRRLPGRANVLPRARPSSSPFDAH